MVPSQFDQFLREVLKLPMAVFEGPSFGYTEQAARTCFSQQVRVRRVSSVTVEDRSLLLNHLALSLQPRQKKVSLNTFLDTLMSDPPPQCLVWLPLMHRLANVENGKEYL